MRLASVTVLLNNLLEEFLPLVPMTPGCVNFNVLERMACSRGHKHGFDRLEAPWPVWVLDSPQPPIHPWGFGWVQAMKNSVGKWRKAEM